MHSGGARVFHGARKLLIGFSTCVHIDYASKASLTGFSIELSEVEKLSLSYLRLATYQNNLFDEHL